MADYFSPTVVQPTIPNADMTALERLLLTHIFESEPDGDGLYFFAETSPNDQIELPIAELRAALASAEGVASETAAFVQGQLKDVGDDEPYVQIDLSQTSYEFILQEIVKRSSTLNHIAIVTSFTCTKMRPDGFGGMAVLVTADAIKGKSTQDIIGDFLDEAEHGPLAAAPGFGVHVLLRLHEQQVRQMIPHLIEADETLTVDCRRRRNGRRHSRRLHQSRRANGTEGGRRFRGLQSGLGRHPRGRAAARSSSLIPENFSPLRTAPALARRAVFIPQMRRNISHGLALYEIPQRPCRPAGISRRAIHLRAFGWSVESPTLRTGRQQRLLRRRRTDHFGDRRARGVRADLPRGLRSARSRGLHLRLQRHDRSGWGLTNPIAPLRSSTC